MFRTAMMTAAAAMAMAAGHGAAQTAAPTEAAVATPAYDAAIGKRAVATLADELEKTFVFPDVAKRYAAALRTKLAAGGYDMIATRDDLAGAMTADLQAVAPDGHLGVRADDGLRPAPRPAGDASAAAGAPRPASPPAMEQAGLIAPGIAYVRFNGFMGQPDVLEAFAGFLDSTAGARVLIVDARTHRGGGLDEMDVLFPRLFAAPVTVMTMDTRASVARAQGPLPFASLVPVDAPAEIHRVEHRVAPIAASPWTKAKVYVLTSGRTGSAGEHFALALKGTGRATLIGDTTAGAGNYGGSIALPGGYSAFVPFGHSYFPGGKGWEGTGVVPDVKIAPERALVEALLREGVPSAEAERLSASHAPSGPMERRRPLRS